MMDQQDGSSQCHICADRANASWESANEAWIYRVPETWKAELGTSNRSLQREFHLLQSRSSARVKNEDHRRYKGCCKLIDTDHPSEFSQMDVAFVNSSGITGFNFDGGVDFEG